MNAILPDFRNKALAQIELASDLLKVVNQKLALAESYAGMAGDQKMVDLIDDTQPMFSDLSSDLRGIMNMEVKD